MSQNRIFTAIGTTARLHEPARDYMALGLWLAVLIGALFLSARGQSILMTAGLMLELTAAYSTFILCGKAERSPLVHGVPYAFAFAGATFLYLAPDFRNAVEASLVFLAVTALMHGSVVYAPRKNSEETEETACASA